MAEYSSKDIKTQDFDETQLEVHKSENVETTFGISSDQIDELKSAFTAAKYLTFDELLKITKLPKIVLVKILKTNARRKTLQYWSIKPEYMLKDNQTKPVIPTFEIDDISYIDKSELVGELVRLLSLKPRKTFEELLQLTKLPYIFLKEGLRLVGNISHRAQPPTWRLRTQFKPLKAKSKVQLLSDGSLRIGQRIYGDRIAMCHEIRNALSGKKVAELSELMDMTQLPIYFLKKCLNIVGKLQQKKEVWRLRKEQPAQLEQRWRQATEQMGDICEYVEQFFNGKKYVKYDELAQKSSLPRWLLNQALERIAVLREEMWQLRPSLCQKYAKQLADFGEPSVVYEDVNQLDLKVMRAFRGELQLALEDLLIRIALPRRLLKRSLKRVGLKCEPMWRLQSTVKEEVSVEPEQPLDFYKTMNEIDNELRFTFSNRRYMSYDELLSKTSLATHEVLRSLKRIGVDCTQVWEVDRNLARRYGEHSDRLGLKRGIKYVYSDANDNDIDVIRAFEGARYAEFNDLLLITALCPDLLHQSLSRVATICPVTMWRLRTEPHDQQAAAIYTEIQEPLPLNVLEVVKNYNQNIYLKYDELLGKVPISSSQLKGPIDEDAPAKCHMIRFL